MKASTPRKQLNIRSDEAYSRAHRLARQRKISVTTVVEQALAHFDTLPKPPPDGLSAEQIAENRRKLDAARAAMWGPEGPPEGLSSDHAWLYDEHGLPK
jgi:hypothetical protein